MGTVFVGYPCRSTIRQPGLSFKGAAPAARADSPYTLPPRARGVQGCCEAPSHAASREVRRQT